MAEQEPRSVTEGISYHDEADTQFNSAQMEGWRSEQQTEVYQRLVGQVTTLKSEVRSRTNAIDQELSIEQGRVQNNEMANEVYPAVYSLVGMAADLLREPEIVSRLEPLANHPDRLNAVQTRFILRMANILEDLKLPGGEELKHVLREGGYLQEENF